MAGNKNSGGPGIPRPHRRVNREERQPVEVSIRIPMKHWQAIRDAAKACGVSPSMFIAECAEVAAISRSESVREELHEVRRPVVSFDAPGLHPNVMRETKFTQRRIF